MKQTIKQSNNVKIDSLKTLLTTYQYQFTELRKQNKQKEAYEAIKKYGGIKDSLQQQEKTQELARINEKQAVEKRNAEEKIKAEELAKIETANKKRINNLKYSLITIFIVMLFIVFVIFATKRIGKFIIPHRYLEGGLFVSFLLLFEFIIVLADPYIEQYTGGAPAWKLSFNMVIAFLIFPVHHFLEEKMRGKLFSAKREMAVKRATDVESRVEK